MSGQSRKVREEVLVSLSKLGVTLDDARRFLRLGATLHRLAEAQCSGYWPADNGERKVRECGRPPKGLEGYGAEVDGCGASWHPSVLRKTRNYWCPDCCACLDAEQLAGRYGLRAVVQGDPRGAVLTLAPGATSREDVDSGRVRGTYVY